LLTEEELPSKDPLAIIVMVGNSLASPHVERMVTKSKINALLVSYYYNDCNKPPPSPKGASLVITIHLGLGFIRYKIW
jgi:hypothetical protein